MKIEYDPAIDALFVKLTDMPIIESEEVQPGIILDFDENGKVAGLEVLNVSQRESKPPLKAAA